MATATQPYDQRGRQVNTQPKGQAPREIDVRKLPPGHATFHSRDEKSLHIAYGHPYDTNGSVLPCDGKWLTDNGYVYNDDIALLLKSQAPPSKAAPAKQCTQCGIALAMSAKFCVDCGTPQVAVLWKPGDADSEAEKLLNLIDPKNPLGSLEALTREPVAPKPRQTPAQIHEELMADGRRSLMQGLPSKINLGGGDQPLLAIAVTSQDYQASVWGTATVVDERDPAAAQSQGTFVVAQRGR